MLAVAALLVAAGPAQPSAAEVRAAQRTFDIIVSALQAKNVPNETKVGLFGCVYEHPIGDISARVTKGFAMNPKLNASDPTTNLLMIARICGAAVPKPTQPLPPAGKKR